MSNIIMVVMDTGEKHKVCMFNGEKLCLVLILNISYKLHNSGSQPLWQFDYCIYQLTVTRYIRSATCRAQD